MKRRPLTTLELAEVTSGFANPIDTSTLVVDTLAKAGNPVAQD